MPAPTVGASVAKIFTGVASGQSPALNTSIGNMIVVCIHSEKPGVPQSVLSVTDTIGNTYQLRQRHQWDGGGGVNSNTVEIWWAISTGANAGNLVTVNLNGATDDAGFAAFLVTGMNPSAPWDPNVSLPVHANSPTGTPTASGISTTQPNDIIIAMVGTQGHFPATAAATIAGAAATQIQAWANGGGGAFSYGAVEYQSFTSAQSAVSATFAGGPMNWGVIADAITADGGPPPLPTIARAMIVG